MGVTLDLSSITGNVARVIDEEEQAVPQEQQGVVLQLSSLRNGLKTASEASPVGGGLSAPEQHKSSLERKIEASSSPMAAYTAIYREVFNLHKEYAPPRSEQSYWTELVQHAAALSAKYKGDPFTDDLLTAVIAELERKYKAKRDSESNGSTGTVN